MKGASYFMEEKIICGIYKIECIITKKVYIGLSTNIIKRKNRGYKNKACISQRLIYNSIKKYGWHNHTFEILYVCDEIELNKWEKYFGDLYQTPGENGLNLRECGGNTGKHSQETKQAIKDNHWIKKEHADEIRQKISNKHIGKVLSEEHKKHISEGLIRAERKMSPENLAILMAIRTGSHHSEEAKQKISIGNKGKKRTQEVKDMIRAMLILGICGRKGMPTSEKTKLKLRLLQLGRKHTKEARENMRQAHLGEKNHFFGKKHSDEVKKIISEKTKKRFNAIPKIGKYDLNGNLIETYYTGHELSIKLGKNSKTWFSAMINSKYHNGILPYNGFIYKFL